MQKKTSLLLILLILPLVFLFALQSLSPIQSSAWTPPPATQLRGVFAPNQRLKNATLIAQGEIYGPEDVAVDGLGRIYAGTQDGKIVRVLTTGDVETFVETGGRPLGLHFDAAGNLIVCDAYKGLLSVSVDGEITVLVDEAEGIRFAFADDLDIARDGKIYFTDASSKWSQADYMLDLFETKPYGRFLVYDPVTQKTTVLLRDMYFPNGVALSQDENFVLINETWRYRTMRFWLSGDTKGTVDVFFENLPGFPDGISGNRNGLFWMALPTPRNALIDRVHPYPWLKNLIASLPASLSPAPEEYGLLLAFDEAGNVVHNLQDPTGDHLQEVTSVEEHDGYIYIGSLHNDRIGRLALSDI